MVRQLANEKTELAAQNSKIAEDRRERLVRSDIANGQRLMDQKDYSGDDRDYSGALLWFAEALPLVTNRPAEEAIHRIRIQQLLDNQPRLLRVLPHESSVFCGGFSPDGKQVVTGTRNKKLRVWQSDSGKMLWDRAQPGRVQFTRFAQNGRRLFVSSSPEQGRVADQPDAVQFAAVLAADTGKPIFPLLTNDLVCAAFSPDDRWLALARGKDIIQLLNAETGEPVSSLVGHTNQIQMLSFSFDGKLLGSASRDQTVRLWETPSGAPLAVLAHDDPVLRVVFSPDNRWIATATGAWDYDAPTAPWSIQTWSAESFTKVGEPHFEPSLSLRLLLFGPNSVLVTASEAREADELHLWESGQAPLRTLSFPVPRSWDVSPDGRLVALGTDHWYASVWNTKTWEMPYTPVHHTGWIESVRFSPDGRQLLTTSDDATAKIWDLRKPSNQPRQILLDAPLPNVGIMPGVNSQRVAVINRNRLLISLTNSTLRLIDLGTLKDDGGVYPAPGGEMAGAIAFDRTGNQWAAAPGISRKKEGPSIVGLWHRRNDRIRYFELPHPIGVKELSFESKGETLVTFADRQAWLWKTMDGTLIREVTLPDEAQFCYYLCSRLDASLPMAQHASGNLQCYDLVASRWVGPEILPDAVNSFAFSPDRSKLAVVGANQSGQVWELSSARAVTPLFKHRGTWVEWASNGRRVVTAGVADVKAWDSATGERAAAPMRGLPDPLIAHFSPDGRFVFSFSTSLTPGRAHQARVWDASTGEPVTPALEFTNDVRAAFMTSEDRLIIITDPGLIDVFDLNQTRLSLDCISDYVHLLAGRKINPFGELIALQPTELDRLQQSLRKRAPELFVPRGN